jgi:hypothetical protein
MGNEANVIKLTASGTTTLNSVLMYGISINKTLAGTLTVNENGTAVAQFAIGTTPGQYHMVPNGVRYSKLTLVLSGADDCTAFTKVA